MEIPDDVYGLQASNGSEIIPADFGLGCDIFNTSEVSQGFLDGASSGSSLVYPVDQTDQSHINNGYVNHDAHDVMFCPEQKYDPSSQYTVEPINIPRSKPLEPLTLTPPRSVGSDSPMEDRGIVVQMPPDSTIDVAKFTDLFGSHSLLSNGLEDPMQTSTGYMFDHRARETEPRRKRRKTEPDAMVTDYPVGLVIPKKERCSISDDVFIDTDSSASSLSNDMPSPDAEVTSYQCLKWTEFRKNQWHDLYDETEEVISLVDFHVDTDKGFNFSFADDSFVCQKKNHFQITVAIRTESTPKYMKIKDTLRPIDKFKIHLYGVKVESTNSTIKVEQSQADRSKRPYEPVVIPAPGPEPSRVTIGRLHFSETTSNNMRKKGKPNPDQRYFMLAVAVHAYSKNDHQMIYAAVSDRIIVRASNPGQFENDVEVVWSRGHTADSVFRMGRVGINNDKPGESLSVHGNIRVTGRILMPSDKRIKENLKEVDSSEQLRNVSKMKLYRYSYSQEYLDVAGVTTDPDTGVIAQEVQEVLPDAVKESEDLKLSDGKKIEKFLVVNKERIFMENVGAVKELCKLTDKLEGRIGELEKVSQKLQTRRRADTGSSCFSSLSRASSLSRTSSSRCTTNKPSPTKERKASCHNHRYQCCKHDCHQQRRQQEVVLEEPSFCTPRFMQFIIIILILVMLLSVGAMAALYIMQDSKQTGYHGDTSEAFSHGRLEANTTTTTTPSVTTTEPTPSIIWAMSTTSMSISTKLGLVTTVPTSAGSTTRRGYTTKIPTAGNSTQNDSSPADPKHNPLMPTEGASSTPLPTTPKPACRCCNQREKCDSFPSGVLVNKPVYYEISNAMLPAANRLSSKVKLRIVEKNYNLNCDYCGSTNETFYVPISSAVPFQPITVEMNSTSDTIVLLCSSTYQLQCPELSSHPPYDTLLKKDSWKKFHHWRLPPAFYFSSGFRFRVVDRSLNPSPSGVNCSSTSTASPQPFMDYIIHFIRVCKT